MLFLDDFLLAGPGSSLRSFEMLQTGEDGRSCEGRVPDFPYDLEEEYMAVINGKVIIGRTEKSTTVPLDNQNKQTKVLQ